MKKYLSKLTAISLISAVLCGCVHTPPGETTPQTSGTDASQTSETLTSSSSDEPEELWIKAPEGSYSIAYNRDDYKFINKELAMAIGQPYGWDGLHNGCFYETIFNNRGEDFVYIKAKLAGESIEVYEGNSNNVTVSDGNPKRFPYGVYSPVIIEKVIDTFGRETPYKENDIIYVKEGFYPISDNNIKLAKKNMQRYPNDPDYKVKYSIYKKYSYDESALHLTRCYPMEKGKSYLIIIMSDTAIGNINDEYMLYDTIPHPLDLSTETYSSDYGETEDRYIRNYPEYERLWLKCKELYGSHFE